MASLFKSITESTVSGTADESFQFADSLSSSPMSHSGSSISVSNYNIGGEDLWPSEKEANFFIRVVFEPHKNNSTTPKPKQLAPQPVQQQNYMPSEEFPVPSTEPNKLALYLEYQDDSLTVSKFTGLSTQQWLLIPTGKKNGSCYVKNVKSLSYLAISLDFSPLDNSQHSASSGNLMAQVVPTLVMSLRREEKDDDDDFYLQSWLLKDNMIYLAEDICGEMKTFILSMAEENLNSSLVKAKEIAAKQLKAQSLDMKWEIVHVSDNFERGQDSKTHQIIKEFADDSKINLPRLLFYLCKYSEHRGIFDYLINKLYTYKKIEDIEFYLPQLVNVLLVKVSDENSASLERFLLEKCSQSLHFGIRLTWLLLGEQQQGVKPSLLKKLSFMKTQVESVTVNRKIPPNYFETRMASFQQQSQQSQNTSTTTQSASAMSPTSTNSSTGSSPSIQSTPLSGGNNNVDVQKAMMEAALARQTRLNYYNDEIQFYQFLTNLSLRLKAYPPGSVRKERCKLELELSNPYIPAMCYVPYVFSNDKHWRIIRIASRDTVVLSTKERVPYMIFVEILENDFSVANPILIHNTTATISSTDTIEQKVATDVAKATAQEKDKQNLAPTGHSRVASNIPEITTYTPQVSTHLEVKKDGSKVETATSQEHKEDGDFVVIDKQKAIEADQKALMYAVFGESWKEKRDRIRKLSSYGHLPNWDLKSFIVKANDDIRQEHLAMQLIQAFKRIWIEDEKLPLFLKPYNIFVTGLDCGLIETITDTISLDSLKKKFPGYTNLKDYYMKVYGEGFKKAQQNFVESMASYSVICYLLQVKDRHNGNLMLDRDGHVIHIDFGFFLSNSPGKINFESAPFKLTAEMVDLMGGPNSTMFDHFRMLVYLALQAATKRMDEIINLVEMLLPGTNYPCFEGDGRNTVIMLRERFRKRLSEVEYAKWCRQLVDDSIDNWRTRQYDNFQRITNGIL